MGIEPYEIIAAPFELYLAPVGEAMPAVDAVPGGNWTLVGTSGNKNITEEGVTVAFEDETSKWKGLGSTGIRKIFRTGEGVAIRTVLADVSLEQFALSLNHNAITTVAAGSGTIGTKAINLHKGRTVAQRALLIRGVSPYDDAENGQFELPIVSPTGAPEIVSLKGEPQKLAQEWEVIEDPNASAGEEFGKLIVWAEVALP